MSDLASAIVAWRELSESELRLAKIENRYGDVSSFMERAKLYERTAQALEIEARTGIAVCACCHKPFGGGGRVCL